MLRSTGCKISIDILSPVLFFYEVVSIMSTDFDKDEVQNALQELKSILASIHQFEEKYQTLLNCDTEEEERKILSKEEHDEKILDLLDKYSNL